MILSNIFAFESIISPSGIDGASFAVCVLAAVVLGFALGMFLLYKNSANQSLIMTISLLPVVVSVIIMLVGNNLGAGVAIAGAFSLTRFRSAPGTAREIVSVLASCALGYACGAGYILVAILLTAIVILVEFLFVTLNIGGRSFTTRKLRITIPESLDYAGVFDDILKKYTSRYVLTRSRTTAMGSLYEVTYEIVLRNPAEEKSMMDELRTRNGNLEVLCERPTDGKNEL